MSTNSECHVVKSDKTYFYFRRDENQFALSKRQGKLQDQQVFSCLAQQRINVKEELTGKHRQVISNKKKRRIAKRGFAQSKGKRGIRSSRILSSSRSRSQRRSKSRSLSIKIIRINSFLIIRKIRSRVGKPFFYGMGKEAETTIRIKGGGQRRVLTLSDLSKVQVVD